DGGEERDFEGGAGLLDVGAGGGAGHELDPPESVAGEESAGLAHRTFEEGDHGEGHEDFGVALDALGSAEAARVDSDDGDRDGVDVDDFADGVGGTAEGALPEGVA